MPRRATCAAGGRAAIALLALACGEAAPERPSVRAAAAAPMAAPVVRQIGEGDTWLLRAPVVYRAGGDSVVVPAGFVAEFAGVPRWFHQYLTPGESFAGPAVVHDYLYWTQRCERAEADALFLRAMREQGVADTLAARLHEAAASWGGTAWRTYERGRAAGVPRFVPAAARPDGSLETWSGYQAYLRDSARATEPPVVASPGLCALR